MPKCWPRSAGWSRPDAPKSQTAVSGAWHLSPILGALLWMIPLVWPRGPDGQLVSLALVYIFGVWAGLIGLAWILSRLVREDGDAPPEDT
jgi:hypothetical protein